jgi:hypothetical protein
MGFLKDLSGWLSGGKSKKSNVRQATIKLKIFNKKLLRQSKRVEITARQAREKAAKLLQEGDVEGSRYQAKTYLQFKNQVRAIDSFRSQMENLQFKIEKAQAIKDVGGIMKGIAEALTGLKRKFSVPEMDAMIKDIGIDIEDFEVSQEIASEGMEDMTVDTAINDKSVDAVLGEIGAEISVETGMALPIAEGNQKIKELEEELERLKSRE